MRRVLIGSPALARFHHLPIFLALMAAILGCVVQPDQTPSQTAPTTAEQPKPEPGAKRAELKKDIFTETQGDKLAATGLASNFQAGGVGPAGGPTGPKKKQELASTGWGSLSGKVTLDGDIPAIVDLTKKMMDHADKKCCLDPKAAAVEKIDATWLVDPKTRSVANVVVWIKPPPSTYFPIHDKLKVRKEQIVIDQPHCAYLPRMSAYQPFYFDGKKEVLTGQRLIIKNSSTVPHNVRATGGPDNPGFSKLVIAGGNIEPEFVPQPLPILLNCDIHTWMSAKLFVFDHPYYAITKEDGTYTIPHVPAGAEVFLMVYHEGVGYVLPELKKGRAITLKAGENVHNFEVKAPKAEK